jgi:hypothetical protein
MTQEGEPDIFQGTIPTFVQMDGNEPQMVFQDIREIPTVCLTNTSQTVDAVIVNYLHNVRDLLT